MKDKRLLRHLKKLRPYIETISYNVSRKSWRRSILFSKEDLVQEACIVLWKVLEDHPEARGIHVVKLFKRYFTNRLASILRSKKVREDRIKSLDEIQENRVEIHFDLKSKIGNQSVLPWDFYRYQLKRLEDRIGKENLRHMIHSDSRKMDSQCFELRREEIIKNLG